MSDKVEHVEQDVVLSLQKFWQRNGKILSIIIVIIAIVIGGWYGYKQFILKPKEDRAEDAMYKAEQYFAVDSSNLALNGDGMNKGFVYVINNYGGTQAANLAKYYAGISYLKLGNYAKAAQYLKDFSTDAKQIQMVAYGALGDALSELGKKDDAVEAYKKAANTFTDDAGSSAGYLFRAGLLSETMGKNQQAVELYRQIKEKYPNTEQGYQIDKYIYRLSIEKNDFSN
jgi:tetratricopeptide (TPR) repeat protein